MKKYILGLDGGATKTQCALFDIEGKLVDMVMWGPTNHEGLKGSFDELRLELAGLLGQVLKKNGITADDLGKSVFGMAGVDTREQHRVVSDIIGGLGIKDFILCNDAYLGVKAGISSGYGICVINGTGCTIVGINRSGSMFQIGGLGGLTGDPGGGGVLGEAAVRSVYNHLFRGGKSTRLADLLYDEVGTRSKYELMEALTGKIADSSLSLSELNKLVFKAADEGDEVAIDILRNAGREFGISVNSMIRELDFSKDGALNVVLAGSVNVKGSNPSLIDSLKREVILENPEMDINFVILTKPPVAGSIIWALSEVSGDTRLFEKVLSQF